MESFMQTLLTIRRYFSVRRLSLALFIVNVIGAIVYLFAVTPSWRIPEESAQGVHSITGEPFIWAIRALPFYAGFGLLNLIWGACICIKRTWQSGYIWLLTVVIWLFALGVDFAHH
jgi:hypothetical protein